MERRAVSQVCNFQGTPCGSKVHISRASPRLFLWTQREQAAACYLLKICKPQNYSLRLHWQALKLRIGFIFSRGCKAETIKSLKYLLQHLPELCWPMRLSCLKQTPSVALLTAFFLDNSLMGPCSSRHPIPLPHFCLSNIWGSRIFMKNPLLVIPPTMSTTLCLRMARVSNLCLQYSSDIS